MFVKFLMVCDVVCMISILDLFSLSYSAMLCVLVGREIGLWMMVFFGLFDECIF